MSTKTLVTIIATAITTIAAIITIIVFFTGKQSVQEFSVAEDKNIYDTEELDKQTSAEVPEDLNEKESKDNNNNFEEDTIKEETSEENYINKFEL